MQSADVQTRRDAEMQWRGESEAAEILFRSGGLGSFPIYTSRFPVPEMFTLDWQ